MKTARFTKKARSERLAQTAYYETMRFPFSVVYTEVEYGVLIHAVADDRRLPEYWLGRLESSGGLKLGLTFMMQGSAPHHERLPH